MKKPFVNSPLYFFLIVASCFLWGSAFAGAKIGFQYCSPIMLSGIRFSLAGLLLVPMLLMQKSSFLSMFKHWKYMLLFGVIQTFIQYGLFFMGLDKVPGAVAAIVVGAGPIFVTILAHFTLEDDKFSARKLFSVVLGFAGIIFITLAKGGSVELGDKFYYGISLLLISNLVGATTNIIVVKNKHRGVSPVALTSFANFSGGIMLFITALLFEPITLNHPPVEFYFAILWLALIPAAGFSMWYYLLGQDGVKTSEVNIWKFIIPIVGAVMTWLFIKGENPSWQEVVGIAIISLSIIILQYSPKKKLGDK
ncbi:MAG: DMT family transporter [Rikenellaceae bacterium]